MKFYITTAIDYLNGRPHIGHVFEKIVADTIARYHREKGEEVFFLTGSDEHGFKMQQMAEKEGITPQELVDRNVKEFVAMKERFNLSFDRFIRTTDPDHIEVVKKIWERCKSKGDLYLKKYQGLYCTECESFKKESDLVSGKCPDHDRAPDAVEEENWFFKLANYKDKIRELITNGNLKIYPEHRKKEVLNILNELEDFSVSRPKEKLTWGIEVPDDSTQVMYVWFDALANYLSGVGAFSDEEKFRKYWPADLHVIGKDITRFHAIYWPAMLLSADIEPSKGILVHGHIISGGKKMSKTLGNTIDVDEALGRYGVDALRYFLLREIPTTEDGDFTWERFDIRYNELANGLGNLVSRVTNLAEKNNIAFSEKYQDLENISEEYDKCFTELRLDKALEVVAKKIEACNNFIAKEEPWAIKDDKEKLEEIIGICLVAIKDIAGKLLPFIPEISEKILSIFKQEKIVKAEPLFPKK
ncbi:methionine--tRNA ligase [Candidatus Microgenomates bacterium]|nr:methionine--tRNA ligase [Candidatus Microgenomates bacterium]